MASRSDLAALNAAKFLRRWCMDRLIPRLSDQSPWELRTSFMPPELPKGSQRRRRDSASQRHALLDMIFKALKSGR